MSTNLLRHTDSWVLVDGAPVITPTSIVMQGHGVFDSTPSDAVQIDISAFPSPYTLTGPITCAMVDATDTAYLLLVLGGPSYSGLVYRAYNLLPGGTIPYNHTINLAQNIPDDAFSVGLRFSATADDSRPDVGDYGLFATLTIGASRFWTPPVKASEIP